MDGRTDRWTDRRLKIHPCVLQDIVPLGPLLKKKPGDEQEREKFEEEVKDD